MFCIHAIFKDTALQERQPLLKDQAEEKGIECKSSIKKSMMRPILESITEETINVSSKNTTPKDNNQVLTVLSK